jgi:hypothetical protein
MKPIFWIPFTTGIFHSLAIHQKKDKQWGTTLSILGTTSLYQAIISIREDVFVKPEFQKIIPSKLSAPGLVATSIIVSGIYTGSFFCLGHLVTKKAYPVLQNPME